MKTLSGVALADLAQGDPRSCKQLKLSGMELDELPDMNHCESLTRLDLSGNKISDLSVIEHLKQLSWLNIKDNEVVELRPLSALTNLKMLNAGNNKLKTMDRVGTLVGLRALILNNNSLSAMGGLAKLVELNTLVLSHNNLTSISGVNKLTNLTKLSVSHNKLRDFPDSILTTQLVELKLNDNALSTIPPCLSKAWGLRLLDLGNNRIVDLDDFKVFGQLERLSNVNFLGNPVREDAGYAEAVKSIQRLKILDSKRVDGTPGKGAKAAAGKHALEVAPVPAKPPVRSKPNDLTEHKKQRLGEDSSAQQGKAAVQKKSTPFAGKGNAPDAASKFKGAKTKLADDKPAEKKKATERRDDGEAGHSAHHKAKANQDAGGKTNSKAVVGAGVKTPAAKAKAVSKSSGQGEEDQVGGKRKKAPEPAEFEVDRKGAKKKQAKTKKPLNAFDAIAKERNLPTTSQLQQQEAAAALEKRAAGTDSGVVAVHTKKTKAKAATGATAAKGGFMSSVIEDAVGLGGSSAWD